MTPGSLTHVVHILEHRYIHIHIKINIIFFYDSIEFVLSFSQQISHAHSMSILMLII